MKLSKKELCIKLAEDYADRVARLGRNYEDAYEHYLERCLKRKEKELMEQYRVQGLDSSGFVI
jgi:hypothetical protein